MWDIGINELYRYFSSESGEIVFDFKIKGPMEKPKFYLGPKTKRALAMMIVDKVADTLLKQDGDSAGAPAPGSPAEEKSDLEKVIDIFKNLKKSD
jgi:hypothetical protein